ncbi:MAG: efflux RND transporter periplasmic adaptor subunit [Desulfobacterota bacterium]|nr:efflux RND transporter periplasmic adaptor subunit [Thermodesulfobacteriota bacterium]
MNDDKRQILPDLSALRIDHATRTASKASRLKLILAGGALVCIAAAVAVVGSLTKKNVVEITKARAYTHTEATPVLNASGYVTPRRRATVAAKITGRVQEMFVEEGMQVTEGQVLALLDSSDARERLRAAEADLEVAQAAVADIEVNLADARRTLARVRQLHRDGVASNEARDKAVAAVDSLEARLRLAKEQVEAAQKRRDVAVQDVENCVVRAPFAGIVVSKDAQVGEMVSPISAGGGFTRTGIATIVDMASLEIEVDVNESFIAKVAIGQKVDAALDAYPEWHIPATVRTIIPTADRQKATVKVRITFDQLDPKILPDMGVKVTFLGTANNTGNRSSVLVKREALHEADDGTYVFVFQDGIVSRRNVTVGEAFAQDIEIVAGLSAGEQVVISAAQPLRDGQRAVLKH